MPNERPGVIRRKPAPEFRSEPDSGVIKRSRAESGPDKRLELGVAWNKRRLTTERLLERGIQMDKADINAYAARGSQVGFKGSEEAGFAEWMLLEGSDAQGMTRPEGHQYRWFGENVVAYPTNEIDDALHGADAILMFVDPEDERTAYPLAVDVTTSVTQIGSKMNMDKRDTATRNVTNSSVYWADLTTDAPGNLLDAPTEGKVQALHASVYLPREAIAEYMSKDTKADKANALMEGLQPFVLRQIASGLEAQAVIFIDKASLGVNDRLDELKRSSVEAALSEFADVHGPKRKQAQQLLGILHTVWQALDAAPELTPALEAKLPDRTRALGTLRRPSKK